MMIYFYAMRNIKDNFDRLINFFAPIVTDERRIKTKKYVRYADQARCIFAEVLLRYILWNHYGFPINKIHIKLNEYGKPLLFGYDNIFFNISHSGDWILCGVSDFPVGLDVEGGADGHLEIADRFFSKEEYSYIKSQGLMEQINAFYKIWTLKESYIKCVGKGLSIPLDSFQFEFIDNSIKMYREGILDTDYIFYSKKIDEKYHIALCTKNNKNSIWCNNIRIVTMNELISWRNEYVK